MTTGPSVSFPMGAVMRNLQFHGTTTGSRREFAEMVTYVRQAGLRPIIAEVVHGLHDLQAIERLFETMQKGEQFGKLVVRISDDVPCYAGKL